MHLLQNYLYQCLNYYQKLKFNFVSDFSVILNYNDYLRENFKLRYNSCIQWHYSTLHISHEGCFKSIL